MIINSNDIFLDVKSYTLYVSQEPFIDNILNTFVVLDITTHDSKTYHTNLSELDKENIGQENHLEIVKNKVFRNILDQISNCGDEAIVDSNIQNRFIKFIDQKQPVKKSKRIQQARSKK